MNTEEILEGARKLSEAFSALGCTISELADAIDSAFRTLFSTQELHPEHETRFPKKYRMPLCKRPQRITARYQYIPSAPRNLPYQRRAY